MTEAGDVRPDYVKVAGSSASVKQQTQHSGDFCFGVYFPLQFLSELTLLLRPGI